jgi:hypothetical protein
MLSQHHGGGYTQKPWLGLPECRLRGGHFASLNFRTWPIFA